MQQTSTVKLPASFSRLQTEEQIQWVKKSKITGEKQFNQNHFWLEGSHGSSKEEKNFVWGIFADLCPVL